jgi:putative ABC transport system ATP-binding protein
VLEARARVRDKVHAPDLAPLVELFDRESYHINSSVGENLVFGTALDPAFQPLRLAENDEVRKLLLDAGLLKDLEAAGVEIARLMVELFADEPADSELFAEYSFISPEDLEDFRALLRKIDDKGQDTLTGRESQMLLAMPFKIVVGRHRVTFPDEEMRQRLVAARLEFQRRFGERNVVEFVDPQRFNPTLTNQDNILFGRPVYEQARAEARVSELVREVALEVGLETALIRRGLDFDVGASGARLNYSQKQRTAIARALMKNADVLVFDEPTSGLDPATERAIVNGVLEWTRGKTVLWALGRAELAQPFDRVLVFDRGKLAEDGTYDELASGGTLLPNMLK